MELMSVECMTKSLTVKTRRGKSLLPLVPDVAVVSTQTDKQFSDEFEVTSETVKALASITTALLAETLSGDLLWLAMRQAERMAAESGVSPEEFNRVKGHLLEFWKKKKASHPLGSMF